MRGPDDNSVNIGLRCPRANPARQADHEDGLYPRRLDWYRVIEEPGGSLEGRAPPGDNQS